MCKGIFHPAALAGVVFILTWHEKLIMVCVSSNTFKPPSLHSDMAKGGREGRGGSREEDGRRRPHAGPLIIVCKGIFHPAALAAVVFNNLA